MTELEEMMSLFYPGYLRERFTNRVSELAFLTGVAEDLQRRQPRHVALFGLRRIGKTLLCQEQAQVSYIITGSAITVMERLIRDRDSPLFLQFRTLELRPFTREDTRELLEKLVGQFPPSAQAAVYTYTFGHPFYVTALAERLREMIPTDPDTVEIQHVQQAFVLEALSRQGQIYSYCRYLHDISLQKARGYGLLKALLQVLAEEEGLSLSDVARRLRRQASATREYLRWLMEVDLVTEEEGRYYYQDPVLRFWVAYTSRGVEVDAFPRWEDLKGIVRIQTNEALSPHRRRDSESSLAVVGP